MKILRRRSSPYCPECARLLPRMHIRTPHGGMHANCALTRYLREWFANNPDAVQPKTIDRS